MRQTARRTSAPKTSQKLRLPKLRASEILEGLGVTAADKKAADKALARAYAAMAKPAKKTAKKL